MRKCCLNCHFLTKSYPGPQGTPARFSWNEQERDNLRVDNHYAAECAQGVWDTGIDPHLNERLPEILKKPRRNTCFFIRMQPGMSYQAAEKLLNLKSLRKGEWRANVALIVSGLALLGSLLRSLLSNQG